MFKQAIISVFVLLTLSACAHKAGKGHDCACGKETSAKCEGGHCATDAAKATEEKGGCEDCKKAGH
jgi:hypothetical protein